MIENLILQKENLPTGEGVFWFYNEKKQALFVGVAKNIREEVQRYFLENDSLFGGQVVENLKFIAASKNNLVELYAETIRLEKPLFNISLSDEKLYPHLKITSENFPRLLVTRRIETDKADYFGAFLPETGVRFLLDFLNRTFRLRNCEVKIDGNFPVPCTQFYEKKCVAPCVASICDAATYDEFVELVRLFLQNKRETLKAFLIEKIEFAAETLNFEKATLWRDILLNTEKIWGDKRFLLRLDDAIDSYEIEEKNENFFIYLVSQRGRRILGKRIFVFENHQRFNAKTILSQVIWQFYQFHAPGEIRVNIDFANREFLSEFLSRREARQIKINIIKPNNRKKITARAYGLAKHQFELQQIKSPSDFRDVQNELKRKFALKRLPERIESFDVAHISGTNFVAAKVVWENGKFLIDENKYWLFAEESELKMLEKGIETSLKSDASSAPDLILIDGGKSQLKAAQKALQKIDMKRSSVIAAVKPPRRHNEVSHFITENETIIGMETGSEAMQLLVRLRDEAHQLANRIHRIVRDSSHFYEMANLLPFLSENQRISLLQKFGSIKKIKQASKKEFTELFGAEIGESVFLALNGNVFRRDSEIKPLIVPIRFDAPNGEAKDLQPLRVTHKKIL